jgi:hypothetical protein
MEVLVYEAWGLKLLVHEALSLTEQVTAEHSNKDKSAEAETFSQVKKAA